MTRDKISREHFQNLLYSFERDEKINLCLIIYAYLFIIVTALIFVGIGYYPIFLYTMGFVFLILIISFAFSRKVSLHLNQKKNKKITHKLKQYLITGKKENDAKFEEIIKKLKLTERQYKIRHTIYLSYLLLVISIEILAIFLFDNIIVFINTLNYNIVQIAIFLLVELSINFLIVLLQTIRFMIFKSVRQLRDFLGKIITKQLSRIEKRIERIMDLKLKEFNFKSKQLLRWLQRWSDVYIGSYFVGLREQLLISDYKKFTYSIGDEVYYYSLFNALQLKIEENNLFCMPNGNKSKKEEKDDRISKIIKLNIKRLNTSIQSRLLGKNERRVKIRMSQTWIAIISITLSIIFSLSRLPSLIFP
ncbi:hypothetical protein LCGC14_0546350 [marine sediment metagenome]|uniref:Uncharacterized protein n=1 Tax=marine sediment metagenome TaxID=412755 RepID=A0A0F9RRA2_9ZZZZ|nr:hypothetical protein [bacterium]